LALFGRRPHERVDRFDIPASENLHRSGRASNREADVMGNQETSVRDGHVLGHRLDNLDKSTP
jgi:hypothetical protein